MKRSERMKADQFFQKLWTAAVGTEDYDKRMWSMVAQAIWTNPEEDTGQEGSTVHVALQESPKWMKAPGWHSPNRRTRWSEEQDERDRVAREEHAQWALSGGSCKKKGDNG